MVFTLSYLEKVSILNGSKRNVLGDMWSEREDVLNFQKSEYAKFSREFYQNKDPKSFILKPTDIILQKTSNLKENEVGSDRPTKFYNFFIEKLHFVLEDQQFKLIYYLMAFKNWNSQQGTHLMYRPNYGVRPDVNNIFVFGNVTFDKE